MAETTNANNVIAQANAVTMTCRPGPRDVEVPPARPGVVIFLHGVNDPGVTYEPIEKGLCQGLNERLSRTDLRPGRYGERFKRAKEAFQTAQKEKRQLGTADADIFYDPDSFEFLRSEIPKETRSIFIPFYWGYRAANNEIAKKGDAGKVASEDTKGEYIVTRGQYQDKEGNRLDAHFAKEGGFFDNATTNIPDMYGEGFKTGRKERFLTNSGLAGPYSYIGDSPDRHYFVLAAHRLAALIRTIRGEQVESGVKLGDANAANETITIIAHSQGSLITLLAQALLRKDGHRCADCAIIVDTPYSVRETDGTTQTPLATLKTFVDIVNEVTNTPYATPHLAELLFDCERHGGRAGPGWTGTQGKRKDKHGNWVTFDERDNRGKVYLYFCPEDTTVGLDSIQGIGTYGMPDELHLKNHQVVPAMDRLKNMRFYQRMWTRLERDAGDGKMQPVLVGTKPGHMAIRDQYQRLAVGPDAGLGLLVGAVSTTSHKRNDMRNINGEQLNPPHAPEMYGGEVVKGGSRPGYADRAGLFKPDEVAKNVALGNQAASFKWIFVARTVVQPNLETYKSAFNSKSPDESDHSYNWRVLGITEPYTVEREETPNEVRARMERDESARSENSYHSAILASSENHRWVTAMDVAIGQGAMLDDPDWRDLLIRMADWRLTVVNLKQLQANPNYGRLSKPVKDLIAATADYYQNGAFPPEAIVPLTAPPLVTDGRKV
ncbi:DUF3274 domain-containing protein [Trinickia sp. NRRL B-1857]|uniref:T6SS effector phospholipase Tle3 domain-containing protein n=1 Tax=Trinickia sp. NRRL B-1857 TaxID=3162879 RepID=UPI003D2D59C3